MALVLVRNVSLFCFGNFWLRAFQKPCSAVKLIIQRRAPNSNKLLPTLLLVFDTAHIPNPCHSYISKNHFSAAQWAALQKLVEIFVGSFFTNNPGTVYLIPTNPSRHFSSFFTQHQSSDLENPASRKKDEFSSPKKILKTYSKSSSNTFYTAGFSTNESSFAGGEIQFVSASSLFSLTLEDDSRRGMRHFVPEPALAQNDH